ncbi:TetR/AcrR family transcriptional regulator [Cohnella cellulosilytica]|uniref:TetR/AcrR family transcriptional regulator n=1 Tax=Cohnella cellulosilytica TaxID=986710 RepID=A0ABW2FN25_9BACL
MQVLKEEVRSAIMLAAYEEFRQSGYLEASMRRIATAAGMTSGNIYRYFRNKEDLFDAIVGPLYSEYNRYAQEYLQTAEAIATDGWDVEKRTSFFERVQNTLVGLLMASGPSLLLLLCRSEGSKYESIRSELTGFVESLLTKSFTAAKGPAGPLDERERIEIGMLAATMIESVAWIVANYHDSDMLGTLVERVIDVFGCGLEKQMEAHRS